MLGKDLPHLVLGILGTGKEIFFGIDHVGQSLGVVYHLGDTHNTADIDPAVADKYPHP